jgi:hypothetical protein
MMFSLRAISASRKGKIVLFFSAAGFLSFAGIVLWGTVSGEPLGSTAFALMVWAVFADVAALIALFAGPSALSFAKSLWILVGALVLGFALSMRAIADTGDAEVVLIYATGVLSFPAGFLAGPIIGSVIPQPGVAQACALWAASIGMGYLQWFKLLPLLRTRRESIGSGSAKTVAKE